MLKLASPSWESLVLLILNCSRYIGMPWGVDRNGETSNRVEKNNVREKDMVKKIGKLHEYLG